MARGGARGGAVTAPADELPLLRLWEATLHELLDDTERFPKRVRYSFVSRIDNAALEVLEQLTLARYAPAREVDAPLARADAALARLRVLLRVAHARALVPAARYAARLERLDEAGRMLGGWRKRGGGRRAPLAPPSGA
ncbi:MAG: four helix bundle protein [Deltaproteobacteria bacterium]|nr:four helix bundle protein [Deltaproteobacteria bacterium]